jgi:hypothetical protein
MKFILILASSLLFNSQIFANYDPSLNFNEPDYDESVYDDRWDYENNDSYAEDPAYEYQDRANVTINMKDFNIPKKDCLIKWNISDTWEKIYHIPGCYYYKETLISKEWEKYFCSEYEAYKAWFRKAINCPSIIHTNQDASKPSLYRWVIDNNKYIEIILFSLLVILGLFKSLRLFLWNWIVYILRFPVVSLSKIYAYCLYALKTSKYSKHELETKIRFLQVWKNKLEKEKAHGFFRAIYNTHLLEILRNKLK